MADVKNHRGRPKIGTARPVKLTMPDELWNKVDTMGHESEKISERIRDIVQFYFDYHDKKKAGMRFLK